MTRSPQPMRAAGLTAQEAVFVLRYLELGDPIVAYRLAFNTDAAAGKIREPARRVLESEPVQEAINKFGRHGQLMIAAEVRRHAIGFAQEMERYEITRSRVLQELARIAFADIQSLFQYDENTGKPTFRLDKLSSAQTRAIKTVRIRNKIDAAGNPVTETDVTLYDKLQALTRIGEELGMWQASMDDPPKPPEEQARRAAQVKAELHSMLSKMAKEGPPTIPGTAAPVEEERAPPRESARVNEDLPDPMFPTP